MPDTTRVDANISAFPFLPPLLLAGRVSQAKGHFENVKAGGLTFSAVDIELHGVRVNRDRLLKDRRVELTSIDSGTVSVEIDVAELSRRLGVPVTAKDGELHVTVAGVVTPVKVSVENNRLVFRAAGLSKSLPIPKTRLVPCATRSTVLANRVRLSCTIDHIPPALLGAANRQLG